MVGFARNACTQEEFARELLRFNSACASKPKLNPTGVLWVTCGVGRQRKWRCQQAALPIPRHRKALIRVFFYPMLYPTFGQIQIGTNLTHGGFPFEKSLCNLVTEFLCIGFQTIIVKSQ